MKQTAVEWLVNELNQKIDFIPMDKWDIIKDIVQHAKAMEKEQIVNAFLLLIKEYKDKELPNCNKPFHYEAEISSGLDGLVNYIKNKQN